LIEISGEANDEEDRSDIAMYMVYSPIKYFEITSFLNKLLKLRGGQGFLNKLLKLRGGQGIYGNNFGVK